MIFKNRRFSPRSGVSAACLKGRVHFFSDFSCFFDEKYYTQLPDGVLESFGRLLINDLKLYVYPYQKAPGEPQQRQHIGSLTEAHPPLRISWRARELRASRQLQSGIRLHLFP